MTGREVTVLAFCDGKTLLPMPASQDHKKAYDGDKGANTGGMGAFAPTPYFSEQDKNEFLQNIALPTLKGLEKEGIVFKGVMSVRQEQSRIAQNAVFSIFAKETE